MPYICVVECILEKSGSWGYCITLPLSVAEPLMVSGNKRVVCTVNDSLVLHSAIMKTKEGEYYITISSKVCKQLGLSAGHKVKIDLEVDTAEYQFSMPEELQEVLDSDPEAATAFEALTDGKKRSIMYLVTLVKSADKRIERALLIAHKIKMGISSPQLLLKK
jgi:hypothetical protein